MKITELKRGMRITLRNGDVRVVDVVDWEYNGTYKIHFVKAISRSGFIKNMENSLCSLYDIMEVEDLYDEGDYYTIWKREETKYYIIPKGMKIFFDGYLGYIDSLGEWITIMSEGYNIKTKFTKQELKELGIDIEHFDLEEVECE